ARRVTTLKVFFRWLHETGVLSRDPAAALIQRSVRAPLPRPLTDEEVDRLLAAAREQMAGEDPDPRPYVLAALLLHTGIKKGECVGIRLADLDLSAREGPSVLIRYDSPRQQHKERRLALPASLVPAIREYLARYQPREFLFPWTARNLEYVLRDLGRQAGIQGSVSFDRLRWTAALRDWKAGMDPDHLRRKLGLSRIAWQEVEEKLQRLSQPAL
ncbi:MAG: tyrosine-type recombinase/integrase, partial [Anaerolineae bacterium]